MSQSTVILLEKTLIEELSNKTLDRINVKYLCDKIGISRQAYYYHFQDIYALLEHVYLTKADEIIGNNKTYDSWIKGFENVFKTMYQYKDFVINTYKSISKEYLENFLYSVTYNLLYPILKQQKNHYPSVNDKEISFIAHFYKYAFVGIVLDWVKRGMNDDYELIIDNFKTVIEGDFSDALTRFNSK